MLQSLWCLVADKFHHWFMAQVSILNTSWENGEPGPYIPRNIGIGQLRSPIWLVISPGVWRPSIWQIFNSHAASYWLEHPSICHSLVEQSMISRENYIDAKTSHHQRCAKGVCPIIFGAGISALNVADFNSSRTPWFQCLDRVGDRAPAPPTVPQWCRTELLNSW